MSEKLVGEKSVGKKSAGEKYMGVKFVGEEPVLERMLRYMIFSCAYTHCLIWQWLHER